MRSIASTMVFVATVCACSSTDEVRVGSGADAGQEGGKVYKSVCEESVCEGHTYMGQTLATCCLSERGCGVMLDGECVATNVVRALDPDAGKPATIGTAETVVLDPSCPDQTFMMGANIVLKGCCDKSGVCGASTAEFAASFGIPIAAMCVTRAEAARMGQRPPDSGPEKTCDYPAEAGAPSDAGDAGSHD